MEKNNLKTVEIAYAHSAQIQTIIQILVDANCTVEAAILKSNILTKHPEIDLQKNKVGIFGKICSLSHVVQHGDRIEIYRPLVIDPKENRRMRARGR